MISGGLVLVAQGFWLVRWSVVGLWQNCGNRKGCFRQHEVERPSELKGVLGQSVPLSGGATWV